MATKSVTKKTERKFIDLLIKCPRCGNVQHEYVYSLFDKPWFKCVGCEQLTPSGAWIVLYMKQ